MLITDHAVFKMDDERLFTNYNSRCMVNDSISRTGKVMNSYEYRMFLQKNAEEIMKKNVELALSDNMCVPCYDLNEDGTMLPEATNFNVMRIRVLQQKITRMVQVMAEITMLVMVMEV